MYSDMTYRVLNKNATYSLPKSYCLHRGSEFTVRGDYNYEKKNN